MKRTSIELQERYVAPACESVSMTELGLLCVSGNGGIDDGTIDEWGNF